MTIDMDKEAEISATMTELRRLDRTRSVTLARLTGDPDTSSERVMAAVNRYNAERNSLIYKLDRLTGVPANA